MSTKLLIAMHLIAFYQHQTMNPVSYIPSIHYYYLSYHNIQYNQMNYKHDHQRSEDIWPVEGKYWLYMFFGCVCIWFAHQLSTQPHSVHNNQIIMVCTASCIIIHSIYPFTINQTSQINYLLINNIQNTSISSYHHDLIYNHVD